MKAIFKAKDGSEHSTAELATARDSVVDAIEAFNRSCENLNRALLEAAQTADGEKFSFSGMRTFWVIQQSFIGLPKLKEVDFWPWHCRAEADRYNRAAIRVIVVEGEKPQTYDFKHLYAKRKNAIAALKVETEKRLAALVEEAADIR